LASRLRRNRSEEVRTPHPTGEQDCSIIERLLLLPRP
jgi:hypothetical protein